jgi:hypothetical protein
MKVLITAFYDLKESLLSAANALNKYEDIEIISYPLFKYAHDAHDSQHDYADRFVEFIEDNKPDVILWWFIYIPDDDFEKIIKSEPCSKIKQVFFNWDIYHDWEQTSYKNKIKYFDCVFVTCEGTLSKYTESGAKKSIYCPPGYDPQIHYMILDPDIDPDYEQFECDISICCTNLYDPETFPDQYINRKTLIDEIYNNQEKYGYRFKIFGPDRLKELYPNSYSGFVKYHDTNKLFNYSKMCLCTHGVFSENKYMNERDAIILGSGGLLYVDPVCGLDELLDIENECVIIEPDVKNVPQQIKYILDNYDDYYIVRYNGKQKSKQFTWDKWAEIIYNHL